MDVIVVVFMNTLDLNLICKKDVLGQQQPEILLLIPGGI